MKRKLFILLVVISMIGIASCIPATQEENAPMPEEPAISEGTQAPESAASSGETKDIVRSSKARENAPTVAASDIDNLSADNNTFAFKFYQANRNKPGNFFFSPYSTSIALAMTYAGAAGNTAKQMAETLQFTLPQERLHPAFNALDLALASRTKTSTGGDAEEGFQLNVVNAIWGQSGYNFLETYLDTLAKNYGAGLRLMDFIKNSEGSRITINNWISDQTAEKIKDLIPEGAINPDTRLVLTNAIYFKAVWESRFDKNSTVNSVFHLLDGKQITVPMMSQQEQFAYASGDDYKAVELFYKGHQLSMIILLPAEGQFETFEKSLDAERLSQIVGQLSSQQIILTIPRFKFSSDFSLSKQLADMGMPDAFDPKKADFSAMDGTHDLFIQDVFHKAFVAVDEEGTEAAAATAVIVGKLSAPPPRPIDFTADRPFIFLIRDVETNSILFLGRVMDPSKE
jgi:serpin B